MPWKDVTVSEPPPPYHQPKPTYARQLHADLATVARLAGHKQVEIFDNQVRSKRDRVSKGGC